MKMRIRLLATCLTFAVVLGGVSFIKVAAQDNAITDQQIELVRNDCVSLKNTLNQLHVSDALLRVNMGQRYELMSTRLMDRLNDRVLNNNLSNKDFLAITTSYRLVLDTFRSDYKIYEEHLTATIKIDCNNQPSAFYEAILLARTERSQVHADVVTLNQYIDQYQSAVSQLEKNYQATVEGVKH